MISGILAFALGFTLYFAVVGSWDNHCKHVRDDRCTVQQQRNVKPQIPIGME